MSTNHNFWKERRAEALSNRGPSAYQPNALPLGQTGSQVQLPRCIRAWTDRICESDMGIFYVWEEFWMNAYATAIRLCRLVRSEVMACALIDDRTSTPSLSWCWLKTTNRSAKFETLKPFRAFSHWLVAGLSSKLTLSIESWCVTGPEDIPFPRASVNRSAGKFDRLWQWRG